jgi:hypothetical protein
MYGLFSYMHLPQKLLKYSLIFHTWNIWVAVLVWYAFFCAVQSFQCQVDVVIGTTPGYSSCGGWTGWHPSGGHPWVGYERAMIVG